MATLKQFEVTQYYRGIELKVLCVTSFRKKFGELIGLSSNYIKNYGLCYDPRYQECIDNPDKLFAMIGSGEGQFVFDHKMVLPYTEYKAMIDEHRKTYVLYHVYLEKTGQNH